jgi:hypothetical protein
MSVILEEVRRLAKTEPPTRLMYGPQMVSDLVTEKALPPSAIVPEHWFYAYPPDERDTARACWQASDKGRAELLSRKEERWYDRQRPFAFHLWGVDGSSDTPTGPAKVEPKPQPKAEPTPARKPAQSYALSKVCPDCNATGRKGGQTCQTCGGSGIRRPQRGGTP